MPSWPALGSGSAVPRPERCAEQLTRHQVLPPAEHLRKKEQLIPDVRDRLHQGCQLTISQWKYLLLMVDITSLQHCSTYL
jgi:hypothetical protein